MRPSLYILHRTMQSIKTRPSLSSTDMRSDSYREKCSLSTFILPEDERINVFSAIFGSKTHNKCLLSSIILKQQCSSKNSLENPNIRTIYQGGGSLLCNVCLKSTFVYSPRYNLF